MTRESDVDMACACAVAKWDAETHAWKRNGVPTSARGCLRCFLSNMVLFEGGGGVAAKHRGFLQ